MNIEMLPFNQLVPSPKNVRKTNPAQSIEQLAATIHAKGLLQNLQERQTSSGTYEVIAGGRRLEALKLLAKQIVLAKDEPVARRVLGPDEDAIEISLTENAAREAMHPSDEFEAFKALADMGHAAEDVAARFGVSALVVRQRLKLAAVSVLKPR